MEPESRPPIRGEAEKEEVSRKLDEMPKEFTGGIDSAMGELDKVYEIKDTLEKGWM